MSTNVLMRLDLIENTLFAYLPICYWQYVCEGITCDRIVIKFIHLNCINFFGTQQQRRRQKKL